LTIHGVDSLRPGQSVEVEAVGDDGKKTRFTTRSRVDNDTEVGYLHHGGILPQVLRELIAR
jgi:aconitate hydratase